MAEFARTRALDIPPAVFHALHRLYVASSADDNDTRRAIADVHSKLGMVIDPHTAVGFAAVGNLVGRFNGPLVFLATAHPAKFPDAIVQAIGTAPEIPQKLAGLMGQEERYTVLPNEVGAVRTFVLERTGTL
jgi:threonine synthase